jgi:hypothetical protein
MIVFAFYRNVLHYTRFYGLVNIFAHFIAKSFVAPPAELARVTFLYRQASNQRNDRPDGNTVAPQSSSLPCLRNDP